MECQCGKGVTLKHLVQVINSQIVALRQLFSTSQHSNSHELLQIIENLQSAVQNEGSDMTTSTSFSYPQHTVAGYTENSQLLYPIINVTVENPTTSDLSSQPTSSQTDPHMQHTHTVTVDQFLSNVLEVDNQKKKKKTTSKTASKVKKTTTTTTAGKGKKKKVSVEKWKRNENKLKRLKGEGYLGIKRVPVPVEGTDPSTCAYKYKFLQTAPRPAKKVGERCTKHLEKTSSSSSSLGFRCYKISEQVRKGIFEYFWKNLDWGQRKIYISALVTVGKVQRRRSKTGNSNRSDSYRYFLRNENCELIRVCKSFFVSTFDIGDRVIRDWVQIPKFFVTDSENQDRDETSENVNLENV